MLKEVGALSLWEMIGAATAHAERQKGEVDPMTDDEFEDTKAALRRLNLPDVRV